MNSLWWGVVQVGVKEQLVGIRGIGDIEKDNACQSGIDDQRTVVFNFERHQGTSCGGN